MKNKNIVVSLGITSVIGAVIFILALFGVFEKLDYRLYDGLIHWKKDPQLSDKVCVVGIANEDIDKFGEWPWSRDIIADTLIYMKEVGAGQAVFDIEYLSPSKLALAKNSLETINYKIDDVYNNALDIIDGVISYTQYGVSSQDIEKIKSDLIDDGLTPQFGELEEVVEKNIYFDNDEYFGKSLQFFGDSYVTVNNIDLLADNESTLASKQYIKERMLNYNVQDSKEYVVRDNEYTFKTTYNSEKRGFTPALPTLISRAKNIGFTNSEIDSDGTRRRIELLYKYDGEYYGQLVFSPIMDLFDANDIVRKRNCLIIKNALLPGRENRVDLKIPLDNHGKMLINWQHENSKTTAKYQNPGDQVNGIPTINIYDIYRLSKMEEYIKNYIDVLNEFKAFDTEGYPLDYLTDLMNLKQQYSELSAYKDYILESCTGYDSEGNSINGDIDALTEQYFSLKKEFFDQLTLFVNGNSPDDIRYALAVDVYPDENNIEFCNQYEELFLELKKQVVNEEEDYPGYLKTCKMLSDVMKDKLCIIGQTASSTTDLGAIPFDKQYANVYIHSNVANTILTQNFLYYYPWYISFIVTFVILLVMAFMANKSSVFLNTVGGIVRAVLILFFILLFVFGNVYIPFTASVLFMSLLDYVGGIAYRYLLSSREKRYITEVASSFANKDTVNQILKDPKLFNTVGERKTITALFSDVQKFSTLSESIAKIYGESEAPKVLVSILNDYLGSMSNEILFNNGTIDKYEGDAIISMFGAPDPTGKYTPEEWSYLCLDSAIRMKKSEVKFNEEHPDLFIPHEVVNKDGVKEIVQLKPLQTRIGINTGDAFVGMMGSKTEQFTKLNYTMMGDVVNLASRLEGVNKAYASWIMCSDSTWDLANTGANKGKIVVRRLDKVRVVGRSTPVQLYNVLGFSEEFDETKLKNICLFNEAVDMYLAREFVAAEKQFRQIYECDKTDETPLVFAERCKNYAEKGVNAEWDGVMNMTSK